jgi:predicted neuraminidase
MKMNTNQTNDARIGTLVSWIAAARCRFHARIFTPQSGRGLPHSKTLRRLFGLGLTFLFAVAAGVAGQPGLLKSEFIYETAPFPSCHASTIVETKSGLVAAWFGGTYERHPDVCIYVSRQEAGRWTPPVEVANGVGFATNRLPTWNPVLFQPKTGPLFLYYKVGPNPREWWGMMMTSTDDGKTWSEPKRLPDGILGPIKNKPVQLANGDILSGASTEGANGWRVHFERSTDGGFTWTASEPVNDGQTIGAIQPSILFYGKNSLQVLGRTRQGRIFEIWSKNGGKTWGKMTLTEMPNPNSGTDAVTLQDGRQLLVYNHNPNNKGRSPLNLAISKDGKKWQAALVLEDDPLAPHGFAYPAIIQTRDGLVHITYTWQRERIKYVVVDPTKLEIKPFTERAWLWPL